MNDQTDQSDPAAVFGCAISLWSACMDANRVDPRLNLSEAYHGIDQLMREVMSIGERFEAWACDHVSFDELEDVWPYFLEDRFGLACLQVRNPCALSGFENDDCLRVALKLELPVKAGERLPVPVELSARNPISGSTFPLFLIQTVRIRCGDQHVEPFKIGDEPFDKNFGVPTFAFYGITRSGLVEHIADRRTYAEAVELARALVPGIQFPASPVCARSASFLVDQFELGSARS
jgi:hypothetical protein